MLRKTARSRARTARLRSLPSKQLPLTSEALCQPASSSEYTGSRQPAGLRPRYLGLACGKSTAAQPCPVPSELWGRASSSHHHDLRRLRSRSRDSVSRSATFEKVDETFYSRTLALLRSGSPPALGVQSSSYTSGFSTPTNGRFRYFSP